MRKERDVPLDRQLILTTEARLYNTGNTGTPVWMPMEPLAGGKLKSYTRRNREINLKVPGWNSERLISSLSLSPFP